MKIVCESSQKRIRDYRQYNVVLYTHSDTQECVPLLLLKDPGERDTWVLNLKTLHPQYIFSDVEVRGIEITQISVRLKD